VQISDINSAGALPALEMTMRFAAQRQKILAHNVANLNTPGFIARDVDPASFQKVLSEAVDKRRERSGSAFGDLEWQGTRELERLGRDGSLRLNPIKAHAGVLGHDRNATDIERLMQDMVENASVFRAAADLLKKQKGTILTAIAQRV